MLEMFLIDSLIRIVLTRLSQESVALAVIVVLLVVLRARFFSGR